MIQLFTALAVAISTMLGAAGTTVTVTPADIVNGEVVVRVRTALAEVEQNQRGWMETEEALRAQMSSHLQSQIRSVIRRAQADGMDEAAVEAIMGQVRQRLQLQLERCGDGACQCGLGEALRATEYWQQRFQEPQQEEGQARVSRPPSPSRGVGAGASEPPAEPQPAPPDGNGAPGPGDGSGTHRGAGSVVEAAS
ncbi:MAG: hypothetical protein J7M15_07295 [Anaerolineae bacterium]|nr:hypothetical protein [Anaerolineae bacterium]